MDSNAVWDDHKKIVFEFQNKMEDSWADPFDPETLGWAYCVESDSS